MQFGQYPAPSHVIAHLSDPHLLAAGARQSLTELFQRLYANQRQHLQSCAGTLNLLLAAVIKHQQYELANKQVLLKALDPRLPLTQGYALVRASDGRHIKKAAQLVPGDLLTIEFTDNKKQARVAEDEQ